MGLLGLRVARVETLCSGSWLVRALPPPGEGAQGGEATEEAAACSLHRLRRVREGAYELRPIERKPVKRPRKVTLYFL